MTLTVLQVVVLMGAAAAFGQADKPVEKMPGFKEAPSKSSTPPPPAKTAKAIPVQEIPAGAKQIGPQVFSYTDGQGKKWLYYKTPFGIAKREDLPPTEEEIARARASEEAEVASITATEDGDEIRFERKGPFGLYRWKRKKAELTETEQKAWERSRKAPAEKAK